jgi:hypothetical protein
MAHSPQATGGSELLGGRHHVRSGLHALQRGVSAGGGGTCMHDSTDSNSNRISIIIIFCVGLSVKKKK